MKTILETDKLVVSHDAFRGGLIADCAFAIARLPWEARHKLGCLTPNSFSSFELSVKMLGGEITTGGNVA